MIRLHLNQYGGFRGYKLCKECGMPMLKKGQKRKHPGDYQHAKGCPLKRKKLVKEGKA